MVISSFWTLVVFIGGFLLLAVLIWAKFNNRTTPEQDRRTEDATRRLYDEGKRDETAPR